MNKSQLPKSLCLELQKGNFCYVSKPTALDCRVISKVTCRQMTERGYHSIIVNAAARLSANSNSISQTWDRHIIVSIWQSLQPNSLSWLSQWLETTAHLSAKQRLIQFADELLLSNLCEGPLLICLSNIDSLVGNSSVINDLLDWVAHCHELRDTYLTYGHLSIVAFGTVIPLGISSHSQLATIFQSTQPAEIQSHSRNLPQTIKATLAAC